MHPHDGGLSPDSDVGTLAPKDCGPIGLGRYAQQDRVRVKAGETYRQPQASAERVKE